MSVETALRVRAKAADLVRQHAARLGMDEFAARTLVRVIEAISIEDRAPKPRRSIVMEAHIEADNWDELYGHLKCLTTQMAVDGMRMSKSSISGGYGSGHVITTDEDASITHDSWAAENQRYVDGLSS